MDMPCTRPRRSVSILLLLFILACAVLLTFPADLKADKGTKKLKSAIKHFERGRSLYNKKKIDAAIAEYRQALQGDWEEPYWHQALGKALEDKNDLQGALEEYRVASQQSPLDSALRSKYERLADKLLASVEPVNVPTASAKTPAGSGEPLKVGEQVSAPVPTYKPEPPYSEKARNAKHQATAVLILTVDEHGNVTDARVVKAVGLGLDEKALETVRTWKFKPARRGGVPAPVCIYVKITFKLY